MSNDTIHLETLIMFVNLGEKEAEVSQKLVDKLREKGIGAELYHKKTMMDQQFKYADRENIPYIGMIGSNELESGICHIKCMRSPNMDDVDMDDVVDYMCMAKEIVEASKWR